MKTKFIIGVLSCLALSLLLANNSQGQVLKRKNIDSLTKTELAAYEHAIQVLNDRSVANPYDPEGYAWQAWVHNASYVSIPTTPPRAKKPDESYTAYYQYIVKLRSQGGKNAYPGECEHGKDLFLFWHRAEFYYFERVLQNADPTGTITDSKGNKGPATAGVTIPYWDFTERASGVGKRFPKAFEDKSSILYQPNRASGDPTYAYTSKAFIQDIVNANWPVFGGYPNATGGGAAVYGGFGRFELEVHNPMHATYCGGYMANNNTAAYDPIFYSFHAYLDFVFDEWIRLNGMETTGSSPTDAITSLNYHLRGDLPAKYNLPDFIAGKGNRPTMSTCSLYLNHEYLGYEYNVTATQRYEPRTAAIAALLDKQGNTVVFGTSVKSPATALHENTILAPVAKAGIVATTGALDANKVVQNGYFNFETNVTSSFKVDVYLHPKSVKPDITNKAFRNKYLANTAANWKLVHEGSDHDKAEQKTQLNIYIAREIEDISKNSEPGDWVITTNLTKY